jgi:hypothetical protein
MLKPQGEKPPLLKQMTDLHGFVDGLEGTYRFLTDTAETELGIVLKGLAKPISGVGIYLGLEGAWAKLQAGDGLGARLAVSSVMIGVLTLTLEVVSNAPHCNQGRVDLGGPRRRRGSRVHDGRRKEVSREVPAQL